MTKAFASVILILSKAFAFVNIKIKAFAIVNKIKHFSRGEFMNEVGSNIRKFRQQKGLTQKELGDLLEISEAMVGQYERGVRNPKLETINKIAAALGVTALDLYGWDEKYNPGGQLADEVELIEQIEHKYGKGSVSLLEDYSSLNELGRSKITEYVSDIKVQPKYQKKEQ